MPKFKYEARDSAGKKIAKTVEGASKEEVLSILKKENLTVLSVSEEGGGPSRGPTKPGEKAKPAGGGWNISFGSTQPKVSGEMLVQFTRMFATMIGAGIPVLECLNILSKQAEDPGFKR